MPPAETFESLRPLLFAIAYRMLASVSEAEDTVQDAFLRYRRALDEGVRIGSLKAWLTAVVTRLCIDVQRSARSRREQYSGVWLPEPLLTDGDFRDPAADAEMAESLSMAFLLLLERTGPVERAVFLLHDVFGYSHAEIAEIIGRTEANCRQIAARARRRVQAGRPRFDASAGDRDRLAERFFAAVEAGEVDGLIELLAADVVVYGDGGGKAPQWSAPIAGADRAARLLAGMGDRMRAMNLRMLFRRVNGQPGAVVVNREGELISVFSLEIREGAVQAFRSVINPDKLRHIGPVADVRALAHRHRVAGRD